MKLALVAQPTFFALLVFLSVAVIAQPQGSRPDQPSMQAAGPRKQRLQHLTQELNLSPEQASSIESIVTAAESKCSGASEPRAFHECMIGQHLELDAAIEAQLDSQQAQKFLELRQERLRPRIGRGAGQPDGQERGPFPPARK